MLGLFGRMRMRRGIVLAPSPPAKRGPEVEGPLGPMPEIGVGDPEADRRRDLERANELAAIIDRHLNYEARGRLVLDLDDFQADHLCPEQRVQMATDALSAAS